MLKIAECTDTFLPVTDGVGRVVYEYARGLSAHGEEVYVVTPQQNAGYRGGLPFEIMDYQTVRVPGLAIKRYGMAMLDRHYRARMDEVKLDIVHAHSPGQSGLEACRLADKHRIPLIGTFHPKYFEDVYRYAHLGSLADAAVKRVAEFYMRCDEIWTVSSSAAEVLANAGCRGHIEIMRSGTDLSPVPDADIRRVQSRFHLSDAPILLSVGQINFVKNLERLIEAAAILAARNVPFQLLFAGSGPDENAARARVREKGLLGTVRFLGNVYDDESLRALYRLTRLNVYPSLYMTAGLVVHEAASLATPSVVMRGSPAAEPITDGVNGFIANDSATELADVIERALKDPAKLDEIGRRAYETIPSAWSDVTRDVLKRYRALTETERFKLKVKFGPFRRERRVMDETLEKRTIDMIGRFLVQDMQHVYAYQNPQPYPRRLPQNIETNLPRATPESVGVTTEALNGLISALESDPNAQVTNLMVLRHGKVILEAAWSPYEKQLPRQLYSLSKSVTGTAIGMLVEDGLLDLDERLVDIFPEKAPKDPLHPVRKIMVRHLLTMSTGSLFNEVGSALTADWVTEFLRAGTKFEPGTAFEYNSMNTYMLSAIVQKKAGKSLSELLGGRLYAPLGIRNAEWETCPCGIEKGGWGLMLRLEDVAKLGQLYLNGGVWDGRRLISKSWIDEAAKKQIDTPNGEMTYGYGYQIWMTPHEGGYLFNGAFGQYMIALPDLDVVVAAFSATARLFAQGGMMQYVDEAFSTASPVPLPENAAAQKALSMRLERLSVINRAPFFTGEQAPSAFSDFANLVGGRVYSFEKNIGGVLPVNLQSVHNCFALGIDHLIFSKKHDGRLAILIEENGERNTLVFEDGGYVPASVTVRGETQRVCCNLSAFDSGSGKWRAKLNLHFIETPFTKRIQLDFAGDELTVTLDESPTVQDASIMLLELAGVTRAQLVRTLMPMLRQEKLQQQLRTYTTVTAKGRM